MEQKNKSIMDDYWIDIIDSMVFSYTWDNHFERWFNKNGEGSGLTTEQLYQKLKPLKQSKSIQGDVFTIILTSVGTEIISFRKRTNKISEEDDRYLTEAITKRIIRKLEDHTLIK